MDTFHVLLAVKNSSHGPTERLVVLHHPNSRRCLGGFFGLRFLTHTLDLILTWLQCNHLHPKNLTHLGHRDHQLNGRTLVQGAAHLETATNGLSPHPQVPQTIALAELVIEIIEALSIVGDAHLKPISLSINLDLHRVGSGMTDDVVEGLFVNEEDVAFELEREPVIVGLTMHNEGVFVSSEQL